MHHGHIRLTGKETNVQENMVGRSDNTPAIRGRVGAMHDKHAPPKDCPVSQAEEAEYRNDPAITLPQCDAKMVLGTLHISAKN